jgi:hypothetical protein
MQIVLIVIYCLMAVLILFGLTFHDELIGERQRKAKIAKSLTAADGSQAKLQRRA